MDKNISTNTSWFAYLMTGFQLVVLAAFLFGSWLLYRDIDFGNNAIAVQAQVVDVDYTRTSGNVRLGNSGSRNAFPTFSFRDKQGNNQRVKVISGLKGPFDKGQTVSILYDPREPARRVQLKAWTFYNGYSPIILGVTLPLLLMFGFYRYRGNSEENQKRLRRNQLARERREK